MAWRKFGWFYCEHIAKILTHISFRLFSFLRFILFFMRLFSFLFAQVPADILATSGRSHWVVSDALEARTVTPKCALWRQSATWRWHRLRHLHERHLVAEKMDQTVFLNWQKHPVGGSERKFKTVNHSIKNLLALFLFIAPNLKVKVNYGQSFRD